MVRVGNHHVELLVDGAAAFPAMLDAIARAREDVRLEMYWVGDDAVGRVFRSELVNAAARGARVRVIVDGFGCLGLPRRFWREVRARSGEVRVFHPILGTRFLHPRGPLARDHRKILVVDGNDGFVGGLNLTSRWERREGHPGWRDTAVRVTGSELAGHLGALFETTWSRLGAGGGQRAPEVWRTSDGKLGVLANSPEDRRRRRIRQAYLWAIRRARRSIDITCAYFAPRRLFVRALVRAVRRGVRVRLLLPERSDVRVADVLGRSWARFLERLGVEVWAYRGRTLHAKTAVVDEHLVTVGSHNLDALSWAYNLECNVVVDDPEVGRCARELFEDDMLDATRMTASRWGSFPDVASLLDRAAAYLYRW
jgi:cardiolipin synthase